MKWLSDQVVDQLRAAIELPDLSGTRYRPLQLLGRGGMGAVWLAEDTALNRKVALKILDIADEQGVFAAHLLREAETLASLEHPGIVPVHDVGRLADGSVFYCMKYVQGQTLDQHVKNLNSISERLRLVQRLAEPLAFAHSRGVLHRDLKPGNIMVGPFGEVLVMDWGLAKRGAISETSAGARSSPPVARPSGLCSLNKRCGNARLYVPRTGAGRTRRRAVRRFFSGCSHALHTDEWRADRRR